MPRLIFSFTHRPPEAAVDGGVHAELADAVGIPPTDVTLTRSHPSSGRKRTFARALDELETSPPEVESAELDEDTAARLRERLRATGTESPVAKR